MDETSISTHNVRQKTQHTTQAEALLDLLRADLAAVINASGGRLDWTTIDVNADLFDSGYLDSLTAPDYLLRLETKHNVVLSDHVFDNPRNTLMTLAAAIEAQLAKRGDRQ